MPALIRGPRDPDAFRVTVNNARWYRDPLPADAKWPAMTKAVPAVTTIKKAWNKPFRKRTETGLVVPLDAYRAAEYVRENAVQLANMHPDQAFTLVATAPERDLARAAQRGTGVHSVIESIAMGQVVAPELHDDDVRPFLPACEEFVREWRPVWRMTEFVVIERQLGFAGTADALVEFPGAVCPLCNEPFGLTLVDWKSRGSEHGAYPEEVCQLGGYALGQYVVVSDEQGNAFRADPPKVDHGAIVSITAHDGYRVYPVEIDEARQAFLGLFETWRIRREGESVARRAVGHPALAPRPVEQDQGRRDPDSETDDVRDVSETEDDRDQPGDDTDTGASERHSVSGQGLFDDAPRHEQLLTSGPTQTEQNEQSGDEPTGADEPKISTGEVQDVTDAPATESRDDPVDDIGRDLLEHARSRVVRIVETTAGGPVPLPWPTDVPTFKSGAPLTPDDLAKIDEWCWSVEALLGLPFPPEIPTDDLDEPEPEQPVDIEPRPPTAREQAEDWAGKGRALLSLLDDEPLARACAAAAHCDDKLMSREHYLALQAVVTQMSDPAGILLAHWSADGVSLRPHKDMENALLAQMPNVDGVITKRTKLEALRRARRVAKKLGETSPKTYEDLCADLLLAACIAVGHGVTESG